MPSYLLILIAYILGSVPVGLVIGKLVYHVDIREHGSGNIGASNVSRTLGKKPGLTAFVLDVLKGFLPVLVARHFYPGQPWIQVLSGLAAIAGHNNSVFLKFTGGKGVATSCGVTIALSWKAAAAGFAVWGIITYVSGFISLGSIISAPVTGFLIWKLNHDSLPYGLFGLLVTVSVIYKHRGNIVRLREGNELSIRDKKMPVTSHAIKPLILASASPRRKELLETLGIDFSVEPSGVDEPSLIQRLGQISPSDLVQELALAKAVDVLTMHQDSVVIGADTVVVLNGTVLGKPSDALEAVAMLTALSGQTHEVYTGFAVAAAERHKRGFAQTTVTFKVLTPEEITAYVATGEPLDKAGAYGIQNTDISPVASIEGDYYNVVGLPLEAMRVYLLAHYPSLNPAPDQPPHFANNT
jgi:MAF protein/acyl-phosphate glycerol 3-phosphate acyltransferase